MLKQSMMIGVALLALLSSPLAQARKDGGGNMSPQHMSQQGRETSNSPMMGQERGQDRAMERMNAEGREHGMRAPQQGDRGQSMGHDKDKAHGKAKGHYK